MKIDGFELYHYELPYTRPVRWFNSSEASAQFVALRLFADGATGVSEATIKPTWIGLPAKAFAALVSDLLLPALRDVNPIDLSAVCAALAVFPGNQVAKGLVQNACAALAANASGQPLWQMLGGNNSVEISWCVTRQSPKDMAREAETMVTRHGFRALKVKGGQGMDVDVAALRAIRAAVGDNVELTVDANGAYSIKEGPKYLDILTAEGVIVAEDTCRFAADDKFSKLVASSPLPILVDSPCISVEHAAAFLDAGASAISVKSGRVGIHEAGKIAALAGRYGAEICSGMFAESALGTFSSLSFSSALSKPFLPAEQSFYLMMQEQILDDVIEIKNGIASLASDINLLDRVDWTRAQII